MRRATSPTVCQLYDECHRLFQYQDGDLIRRVSISRTHAGERAGGLNGTYMFVSVFNKSYRLHRIVFLMFHGYLPDRLDHKDCNPQNNRLENLRVATAEQNQRNVGLSSANRSGVKGVCWNASDRRWIANCSANGKRCHLGCFTDLESAAAAVRQFREQHHGEFANHG